MHAHSTVKPQRDYGRLPVITAMVATFVVTSGMRPASLSLQPSGYFLGVISGVLLACLVGYGVWSAGQREWSRSTSEITWALGVLLALFAIKIALLPMFPGFGPDVASYQAWAARIAAVGPARTYEPGFFIDYPPGYLYALWLAGVAVKLFNASGTAARTIVEAPALVGDVLLGLTIFLWMRRRGYKAAAWAGMLLIVLNPSMLFDSVIWGQSDSLITLTMLLSTIAALDTDFELAWGLAALATLVKPQALSFLPVLGLWTIFNCDWRLWWRPAAVFFLVAIIGIAPFQLNHPWTWIFSLYAATAAYYHESSVNAFNLMALLGGLRKPDVTPFLGIPLFDIGMALLVPLYAFVGLILRFGRDPRALLYAVFLTLFGFFMFAPRMHERYLYPALAFAVPLAMTDGWMLLIFCLLSLTMLFNLSYVKHALETVVFLQPHDWMAMATATVNLLLFGAALWRWQAGTSTLSLEEGNFSGVIAEFRSTAVSRSAETSSGQPLPWQIADTLLLAGLLAFAAVGRFWTLNRPPEIVFDEVHFVAQARHYLLSEPFLDPHPPLAKLLIAAGIWLFGDHPWSWRIGNAIIGTALIGITFVLARRLFRSRLAAAFASMCVAADGLFLVDSRIAVIDIVYVAFGALAYLFLFRFFDFLGDIRRSRLQLVFLGIALGLCVGSKLYIPAITWLLAMAFLLYVLLSKRGDPRGQMSDGARVSKAIGAVLLVGTTSGIFYLTVFLPHYFLGWWGGIGDLFKYYGDVIWYENSVASATHPYASPWWSWPLMLRPVAYWQSFPKTGPVATVWGGGNPVLWWGGLTAITVMATRLFEKPTRVYLFLVIGYVAYLVIWIPIGRTIFLYHYMPAIYLAYLALGLLLADCWTGQAQMWEQLALLLTLAAPFILGLGATVGAISFLTLAVIYAALLDRPLWAGRLVCVSFAVAGFAAFIYFFPIWTGIPITREGYYARMWFQGPGLRNWI